MWRFIYRKVNGRPGNSSLRLGQIQAAEKNEDKNSSFPEENDKGPLQSRRYHGKALLVTEAKKCGEQEMEHFKSSYDLVRCILNNIQNAQKNRTIIFSNCFARGKEDENSNPFHGELRLWCSRVLALSSLLACRKFITDEKSPWGVNIKAIPSHVLSKILPESRFHTTLGVLPFAGSSKIHNVGNAMTSDPLDQAIATFQASFSECTAATQNKLGIKFASLKQHQKAFLLFMQAGDRGHPMAQFNLGLCYENGKGVEKDLVKAVECYENAAAQGQAGAMYNLAILYMQGEGGLSKDLQHSIELLKEAAEHGLCKAQSFLGLYYADESSSHCDYEKAVPYLKMAAAKNDSSAEYTLGICYERGLGVEKDMPRAGMFYKSAAEHGHTGAQYNIGVFFEHGLGGFVVNKREAARFYRMAAEAGDEYALHNLVLLRKSVETEKLVKQSVKPQNLVFSLFKEMVKPSGMSTSNQVNQENQGIPRCASSPVILDQPDIEQQSAPSNTSNALLAF